MTILEALIQLRNDLKLWVTNNLRVKLNKNLGTEESGKYLTIDTDGEIVADDIGATKDELGYLSGVTSNVQEQLDGKADTSHTHDEYLEASDIEGYATETYVNQAITNAQLGAEVDLSSYYTKTETDTKIEEAVDAIEHPTVDLTPYATTEYVDAQLGTKASSDHTHDEYLTSIPAEYITETELNAKGYLTEHQDLSDYAKTSDVNTSLESYYTKTDIDNKGYAVATDVANTYAVKTDVSSKADTSYVDEQLETKANASHTHTIYEVEGVIDELNGIVNNVNSKQDTLVSGTNIKTINGESVLGEGDITIDLTSLGITATATELNYMDGVTSNVQTQLNGKADAVHSHDEYATISSAANLEASIMNALDGKANTADIPDYIITGAKSGTTIGAKATAEGNNTTASGDYSHAEGNSTTATGFNSHAEGEDTTASGDCSHAEGYNTEASAPCSHAEGEGTTASGYYSHAEGYSTIASGYYSHAGGCNTIANDYQCVVGKFNADTTAPTSPTDTTISAGLFIVGIGSSEEARSNGFRVSANGKVYGIGTFGTSGADYAEYFEWFDGNPNNEDRRGRFVTLEGDKIRYATPNDDYILGVVSADPSVAGDIYSEDWHNKYLKDIYGSKLVEVVEIEETTNEKGEIIPAHTERRWVLNPDYNPDVKYTSREERPEWAAIGVVGKLVVVDDGTCQVNGYCYPNADGIATASQEKTNYRVMERLDDAHIKIFIR